MTQEDVVRMAREAYGDWYPNAVPHELERFANLVAAAEREACAEICDRVARRFGDGPDVEHYLQGFGAGAFLSAKKIRARGQE